MRRMWTNWAGITLAGLFAAVLGCNCYSASEADRWPCPEGGIIAYDSGLCVCRDPAQTIVSISGSPCEACNSQDGNGKACICVDGQLLSNDLATCSDCPQDCAQLECTPPGCEQCPYAPCPTGHTCDSQGSCIACQPGMCGGDCGECAHGSLCIDGYCQPGALCCLEDAPGDFCSRAADFCILPALGYPAQHPCYCDVVNSDGSTYCSRQIPGKLAGPGGTCP